MFCRHCGKEIADEAVICPACGVPVYKSAPQQTQYAPRPAQPAGPAKVNPFAIAGFCVFFGASVVGGTITVLSPVVGYVISMLACMAGLALSIVALVLKSKKGYNKCNVLGILGVVFNSIGIFSYMIQIISYYIIRDLYIGLIAAIFSVL